MSFFRAGKGGGATETLLWTNPNPSSDMGSSGSVNTVITLSESYDNYDMLRIKFKNLKTDATANLTMDIDPSVLDASGNVRYFMGGTLKVRHIMLPNAQHTTLTFGAAYTINSAAGASFDAAIPAYIYGIKN